MASDGFVLPLKSKRPKNTKGLSLAAESLAPPSDDSPQEDYSLSAYITQPTPKTGLATLDQTNGDDNNDGSGNTGGKTLMIPKPSKVSRKKPAGLGIKSTRPAPDAPLSRSAGRNVDDLSPSGSFTSTTSTHSISSRVEIERGLAEMEISSHSRSSSKLRKDNSSNDPSIQSSSSSAPKRTRKKTDRSDNGFPELKDEDLKVVGDLGAGNGGTVNKVLHTKTGVYMAKKLVLIDAKPAIRKQILRELQIMHHCSSEWIVSFYGAFLADVHVGICMEYMDRGSLDGIYKKHGAIPINIVGKVAQAVLEGLTYLYDEHRIIHRDIKPSNILVNSKGEIKICDFGVSGELINSIANTFVGTSTYMSPERIQGGNYSVKSDVWSLGISLIELALGRFPFSDDEGGIDSDDDSDLEEMRRTITGRADETGRVVETRAAKEKKKREPSMGGGGGMSILDLLQHIVNEPAPRLVPAEKFPAEAEVFIDDCLKKAPEDRKNPKELLKYDWIQKSKTSKEDLEAWAVSVA